MKKDINDRQDIEQLLTIFYGKVMQDAAIGHLFTKEAGFDLAAHLPVMVSFWETVLLGANTYNSNPMKKHIALNERMPLEATHFAQWLFLWETTVNELFSGETATEAIAKAQNVAVLMQHKLSGKGLL